MSVCYFSLLNFLYGVNNNKITQVNKVQGKKEICSNQGNKLPKTTCRNYSSYTRPKKSLSISFPCQISSSRNFSLDGTCSKLVEKDFICLPLPQIFPKGHTSLTQASPIFLDFMIMNSTTWNVFRQNHFGEYACKGKNKK